MKRLLVLIIPLLLGCAAQQVTTEMIRPTVPYTYDGEFDPFVFLNWDVLGDVVTCEDHRHIFLENPDKSSSVELIEILFKMSKEGHIMLKAYRYFKYGVWYVFALDEHNHFEQIEPSQEEEIYEFAPELTDHRQVV